MPTSIPVSESLLLEMAAVILGAPWPLAATFAVVNGALLMNWRKRKGGQ